MRIGAVCCGTNTEELIQEEAAKMGADFLVMTDLEHCKDKIDLAFLRWPQPGIDPLQLVEAIRKLAKGEFPTGVVLLLSGEGRLLLERARSLGARDALLLPVHSSEIRAEILDWEEAGQWGNSSIAEDLRKLNEVRLIGKDEKFLECLAEIGLAGRSDANVLLLGETGTGKELFALSIHEMSRRQKHPYLAVNCASLAPTLMESELFGHAKGSFTGAERDHMGRFEAVREGTLLLDEIGDIDLPLQSKLLRVIENRRFERVGENQSREFRGRIVAATSVDLAKATATGKFRSDLLGRLNQLQIRIPALRERASDIPLLVNYFMRKHASISGVSITPSAMLMLQSCSFPMNVRQLENAIVSAIARSGLGGAILPRHLPAELVSNREAAPMQVHVVPGTSIGYEEAREKAVRIIDKQYLEAVLGKHDGNQSAAAEELGIDRKTFATRWKAAQEVNL